MHSFKYGEVGPFVESRMHHDAMVETSWTVIRQMRGWMRPDTSALLHEQCQLHREAGKQTRHRAIAARLIWEQTQWYSAVPRTRHWVPNWELGSPLDSDCM